jgi:hypothetical protein
MAAINLSSLLMETHPVLGFHKHLKPKKIYHIYMLCLFIRFPGLERPVLCVAKPFHTIKSFRGIDASKYHCSRSSAP